ncbi:hypothetical protein BN1708_006128 [Verticillium longisporum]|uniref:Uncharacterized protein n=1 Tax=Verticillium longisporum TaxID=100787 RepID=A0A0G4MHI2_VERLO|nr:hypothetical protein BN1708_006128 [Verticillium longisporum]
MARSDTAWPSSDPGALALAAHVADAPVLVLEAQQALAQLAAPRLGGGAEAVAAHNLEDLGADGGGQRVVEMGRQPQEALGATAPFDLGRRRHGRQRQAGAQRLGQAQNVGRDAAVVLKGEHAARAADARLRLVADEQHAPRAAPLGQRGEVPLRQVEDAARAEDGLEDERRQRPDRLPVDEGPAVVELGAPVVGAVGAAERRPVAAAAPAVSPWYEAEKATISNRPVYVCASRMAASVDSDPVLRKNDLVSGAGSSDASACARSSTGCVSMLDSRWSRFAAWWLMTAAISGCAWPIRDDIWPDVKSRIARPVES